MESKRKFDEKILRENEQYGRQLDQQVKELDKLKLKFEKRLATEKERFAVQHLSVSSDYTGKNGARRKKISLAIDPYQFSSDSKLEISTSAFADNAAATGGFNRGKVNRVKSLSVPDLNKNAVREDCLFPPLANDKPRLMTVKSRSQTLSGEESRFDITKGKGKTRKKRTRYHSESTAPVITITDPQGDFNHRLSRPRSTSIIFEEFNPTKSEKGFNATTCDEGINIPLWQRQIMTSMNVGSEGLIAMTTPFTDVDIPADPISNHKPKSGKTRKTSKAILPRSNKEDEKNVDSKLSDLTITKDRKAEVNMIKNLSKQQRCDMEQQVTILPRRSRIFSEDLQTCLSPNEMTTDRDTRRLGMAKKRWMKAYDIAKNNIYGNEANQSLDRVHEALEDAKQTQESCTKDPRLQRLVSVLSKNDNI